MPEHKNILFVNPTVMNDFGNGAGKSCYKVFHGTEHKGSECPLQKAFVDLDLATSGIIL